MKVSIVGFISKEEVKIVPLQLVSQLAMSPLAFMRSLNSSGSFNDLQDGVYKLIISDTDEFSVPNVPTGVFNEILIDVRYENYVKTISHISLCSAIIKSMDIVFTQSKILTPKGMVNLEDMRKFPQIINYINKGKTFSWCGTEEELNEFMNALVSDMTVSELKLVYNTTMAREILN